MAKSEIDILKLKIGLLRQEQKQIAANKKELLWLRQNEQTLSQLQKVKLQLLEEENKRRQKNTKSLNDLNTQLQKARQNIKEALDYSQELDNTFISVSNAIKDSNKYTTLLAGNLIGVEQVAESITGELQKGTVTNAETEQAIMNATGAYKDMQVSIAQINKEYIQGRISAEERIRMIQQESNAFLDVAHSINTADIQSDALKESIKAMVTEGESFGKAMKKAELTTQVLDDTLSGFSGVPVMSEINTLLKTNIKDTVAWKAAVFAVGAAVAKLALDLTDAGTQLKAGMEAAYNVDKSRVGLSKTIMENNIEGSFIPQKISQEVAKEKLESENNVNRIKKDGEFTAQKIALESARQKLDNQNQLNQMIAEAAYAGQKAANAFNASMKSAAVEFQAASKTALFGKKLGSVGYGAAQLQMAGISADKIASAMQAAADATGKMPTAKIGADMSLIAERTGASVENVAQLNEYFQRTDGVSEKMALNLQEGMRNMADKAGLNLSKFMQEVAEASKDALGYQIKSGPALAKQVAYAQSLGVSFGDIAKAGKNMVLNYKDSIKAEMQLSTLLGKQVDLSEVRAKFASGDQKGALEALKAQGLDPESMDMFQQEALSSALGGMDLQSLSKIAKGTGKDVGDLKAGDAEKGGKDFLNAKVAAEKQKEVQQAQISANAAIIDAKLSNAIAESYTNSPAYKQYQEKLNELAAKDAELASSMTQAYLNSPNYLKYQKGLVELANKDAEIQQAITEAIQKNEDYQKLMAKEMQIDAAHGIKEALLNGLTAAAGGFLALAADKIVSGVGGSIMKGISKSSWGQKVTSFFGGGKSETPAAAPTPSAAPAPAAPAPAENTSIAGKLTDKISSKGGNAAGVVAGPLLEAAGDLTDGVTEQLKDQAVSKVDELIPGAGSAVGGIIDGLKESAVGKLDDLVSTTDTSIAGMASNVDNVNTVTEKVEESAGNMKSFGEKIRGAITEVTSTLKTFIKSLQQIGSQIVSSVGKLLKDIMGQFQSIGTQLIKTIESVVNQAINTIGSIGGKLIDTTTGLIDKFGNLLNKVAEIIGQVANKIATEGMKVFNTVIDGLTKASNSLPTILGNLGKAIGSFFEGIGPGLATFGQTMATPTAFFGIPTGAIVLAMMMGVAAALAIAAPAIEKLTPLLIGLADSIGGTFVEMLQAAAPIIKEVFDGIANVINTVGNTVVKIIDAVTNSIATFATIDAMALLATAGGIAAIAGALALFGGGSILAGIGSALGEFFGGDPVEKFRRFASIDGGALQAVAKGVIDLGNGLRNFSTGNLSAIPGALAKLNEGINKNLSASAANLMATFGATIKNLSDTLVTFASAITTINSQAAYLDNTTAAFDRLGAKLLEFPKLSDIQPAIDGIKGVSQASPTPESAQAFYVWNTAFTGFNQNMVIMSGYPGLVAQLVPMFQQLTMVTNSMGNELNLIAQVPFANFLGLAQGLTALGMATPTFEQAEAFSAWTDGFEEFTITAMQLTGIADGMATIASTMDATAAAIFNLADAFTELAKVDINAVNDLPWIRMTAFAAAGGGIQLVQAANKSFNITQDSAKNIQTTTKKIESTDKNIGELIKINKNLQALLAVLADSGTAAFQLNIDGRAVTNMIEKRKADRLAQNKTEPPVK